MRPLCRIRSISAADLQTIAMLCAKVLNNPEDLGGDFVHRTVTIYCVQSACALVVVRYRGSQSLVSRQTGLNYFKPVIIAGDQLRGINIANFVDMGPLGVNVIDPPTGG